ncbi:hypothetical protein J6590_071333 [Homalodisca vitripennis]|nr:hypothetical protein J6590_071333 [Homalodisca vitripennis]
MATKHETVVNCSGINGHQSCGGCTMKQSLQEYHAMESDGCWQCGKKNPDVVVIPIFSWRFSLVHHLLRGEAKDYDSIQSCPVKILQSLQLCTCVQVRNSSPVAPGRRVAWP